MSSLPADVRKVMETHKHDTVLFLLGIGESCASMARRIASRVPKPRRSGASAYGRDARWIGVSDLQGLRSRRSWALAVFHCGGDAAQLLKWANTASVMDRSRVRFHLAPGAAVPEAWPDAVTESPALEGEREAFRMALEQLNQQTYRDHADPRAPGVL